jgi:hypothetical protein
VYRGRAREAGENAAVALTRSHAGDREGEDAAAAYVCGGMANHLGGDTLAAEQQFRRADVLTYTLAGHHLNGHLGVLLARFLLDSGRTVAARRLAEANLGVCRRSGWGADQARCHALLARAALVGGRHVAAGPHVDAAVAAFRAGDYLVELTAALVVAAERARQVGDLDEASKYLEESINHAGPRGLVPTHSAALAAGARVSVDRYVATGASVHLFRGRDAADSALRLAVGPYPLPWAELDAYRAHASLDRAENVDHGWAARAQTLHGQLVPFGLDPDPLSTVEDVAAREA